jgi:hypothetical protein
MCQDITHKGIPYQAMIVSTEIQLLAGEDSHFSPLKNTQILLRLFLQSKQGEVYYAEEHWTQTNEEGYFSLVIGRGQPLGQNLVSFVDLDWSIMHYFLRVEWSKADELNFRLMSIQPLLSVPYALYAEKSGGILGKQPYDVWLSMGNQGSQLDFFKSLKGERGEPGEMGQPGDIGERGLEGHLPPGYKKGNSPYWMQSEWKLGSETFYVDGERMSLGEEGPDSSAILSVSSRDKGFLPNRMTIEQRDDLVNPPEGLMIFNTTTGCPNYYQGNKWWEWCGGSSAESLECSQLSHQSLLLAGQKSNDIPFSILYSNGNGDPHEPLTITSNGVKGLVATLEEGFFSEPSGQLIFKLNGTAQTAGLAEFHVNVGGLNCSVQIPVKSQVQIGDAFQGGIVAHIFQPGEKGYVPGELHGVIVAEWDLPMKQVWGPFLNSALVESLFFDLSTDVGWGRDNSLLIASVADQEGYSFPALREALQFSNWEFRDWFLPSSEELVRVKNNLASQNIANFVTNPQGFGNLSTGYWSSSIAQNFNSALAPMMAPGAGVCGCAFFESYYVRPVRYF